VLILNNVANTYIGSIAVSGGRLDVSDDAQLGVAAVTVNPFGVLRYIATTTTAARNLTLNSGTLDVVDGAALVMNGASVGGGFLRGPGTVELTGGTSLSGVTTQTNTTIVQTGSASVTNFTNGGSFTVGAGQTLAWNSGTNTASGRIVVDGTANVSDPMHLNGGLLVNNGNVTGTVNVNAGAIAMGSGFFERVNVNRGGAYSPGNGSGISNAAAANFDSSTVAGGPTLIVELAGITPGTGYDQLHVTGHLSLGGTLEVSLQDGFAPAAGNSFDILDWGTLSGAFSAINLPTLAGLAWNTSQLYTTGVLSIGAPALPGDFNQNGVVDAADYVVYRSRLGTTYTQTDYDVWRANFGQSVGNGAALPSAEPLSAAVPESATLLMLLIGTLPTLRRRHKRR
jgi:autotransporter-associated beta strand protein